MDGSLEDVESDQKSRYEILEECSEILADLEENKKSVKMSREVLISNHRKIVDIIESDEEYKSEVTKYMKNRAKYFDDLENSLANLKKNVEEIFHEENEQKLILLSGNLKMLRIEHTKIMKNMRVQKYFFWE